MRLVELAEYLSPFAYGYWLNPNAKRQDDKVQEIEDEGHTTFLRHSPSLLGIPFEERNNISNDDAFKQDWVRVLIGSHSITLEGTPIGLKRNIPLFRPSIMKGSRTIYIDVLRSDFSLKSYKSFQLPKDRALLIEFLNSL
jgi:hypothetical protein